MTALPGSASGENTIFLGSNKAMLALEVRVTAFGHDYQTRSNTYPRRCMHAGWFAFSVVSAEFLVQVVTWHNYVEFEAQEWIFVPNTVYGSSINYAIPAGTTVQWVLFY